MENIVKSAVSKVKEGFGSAKQNLVRALSPNPEEMIENMTSKNFHPVGKPHWEIAKRIVASPKHGAGEKLDMLFDLYGKYYIYQHENAVNFAVLENYYEQIMFRDYWGYLRQDNEKFREFFNSLSAEQNYIINRRIGDCIMEIFSQINSEPGAVDKLVAGLDSEAEKLMACMTLPNNYFDRNVNGTFYPTREESVLTDTLIERYKLRHPQEFVQKKTFEFTQFLPEQQAEPVFE